MLSEKEAIKRAVDFLKTREGVTFVFHSASHMPAAIKPGRYKKMGDTWVVRFQRAHPEDVDETGFTIVDVNSSTGDIVTDPAL